MSPYHECDVSCTTESTSSIYSCLVMFGGGSLALERILVTCLRILSSCSKQIWELVDSIWTDNLFFWNLSRFHCEVRAFGKCRLCLEIDLCWIGS